MQGIPILTEDGERVGVSAKAAQSAISQVMHVTTTSAYEMVNYMEQHCYTDSIEIHALAMYASLKIILIPVLSVCIIEANTLL